MLTPKFHLDQDKNQVFIHIHAPFIKIIDADCYVSGDEFYFHAEPYYLRLHLPGEVSDDEQVSSQSEYNHDTSQLTVRLTKTCPGQHFEGLDLLTKLLTHKSQASHNISAGVEVIDSSVAADGAQSITGGDEEEEGDDSFDWHVEQCVRSEDLITLGGPRYGFAKSRSGALQDITSVNTAMLDLNNPDAVPEDERKVLRVEHEKSSFNCEHYLADFFDDEAIQDIMSFCSEDLIERDITFSEDENKLLTELPRKEYLIDKSELKSVYLGLVDLVYAYCYNYRFTYGSDSVESDWIICKLSSTLSWLDSFDNIKDVVASCARRSLCYPLYRNWKLVQVVISDVVKVFKAGKKNILRCLLGIYKVLSRSETFYPMNDLYIKDYCVWLQSAGSKQLESISSTLGSVEISKDDLGLCLVEMEQEASALMDESSGEEDSGTQVGKLSTVLANVVSIKDTCDSGTDSDDEDDDEDSEEEDDDEDSEEDDEDSDDEEEDSVHSGEGKKVD